MSPPQRGEIWDVDFSPTRGHELSRVRPALVVSSDDYNRSPAGLVVVLPITRTDRHVPWHLPIAKGQGGLTSDSVILCDHLRSVSIDRMMKRRGEVAYAVLEDVQLRLRYLLEIP